MFLNYSNLDPTRYDYQPALSYKRMMTFVVGDRRVGKTFKYKLRAIKRSLIKHAITFMWLRIMKTEIDEAKASFFEDIEKLNVFPEYSFKVVGNYGYATLLDTGETFPICYFGFIKNAQTIKGTAFPYVECVYLDEFMQEEGMQPCRNMVTLLFSILYSVFSLKTIRCVLLGNAVTMVNPFFVHYGVRDINRSFTKGKDYVIENVNFEPRYAKFRENAKQSDFGKLVKGTDYEKYALDNKFVLDDTSDVEKKKLSKNDNICAFQLENLVNVYVDKDYLYFEKVKKTDAPTYTPFVNKAKNDIIYMKYSAELFKRIFSLVNVRKVVYSDLVTKSEVNELMKKVVGNLNLT